MAWLRVVLLQVSLHSLSSVSGVPIAVPSQRGAGDPPQPVSPQRAGSAAIASTQAVRIMAASLSSLRRRQRARALRVLGSGGTAPFTDRTRACSAASGFRGEDFQPADPDQVRQRPAPAVASSSGRWPRGGRPGWEAWRQGARGVPRAPRELLRRRIACRSTSSATVVAGVWAGAPRELSAG